MGSEEPTLYVTKDLSLAAYLRERGLPLHAARRGTHGDFEFLLEDRDGAAQRLAVDWVNSCCRAFEGRVQDLKALLRSGHRSGRT